MAGAPVHGDGRCTRPWRWPVQPFMAMVGAPVHGDGQCNRPWRWSVQPSMAPHPFRRRVCIRSASTKTRLWTPQRQKSPAASCPSCVGFGVPKRKVQGPRQSQEPGMAGPKVGFCGLSAPSLHPQSTKPINATPVTVIAAANPLATKRHPSLTSPWHISRGPTTTGPISWKCRPAITTPEMDSEGGHQHISAPSPPSCMSSYRR